MVPSGAVTRVGRRRPSYCVVVPGQFQGGDWAQATHLGTTTQYDGRRRPTLVTAPDGTTVQTAYPDWATEVIDPLGRKKRYENDAHGRLVKVIEYTNGTTQYAQTHYQYDVANQLTQVTDAAGNVTRMQYDALGRKVKMHDPDLCGGTSEGQAGYWWVYAYNALSLLIGQADTKDT